METRQTSNEMFERVDVSFVFVVRFLPFLFCGGVHFEIFTVWKSDVQHQKVELVKPVVNVRIPVSRWRLRQNIGGDHIQILPQKTRDLHSGSTREFVSSNLKKIWLNSLSIPNLQVCLPCWTSTCPTGSRNFWRTKHHKEILKRPQVEIADVKDMLNAKRPLVFVCVYVEFFCGSRVKLLPLFRMNLPWNHLPKFLVLDRIFWLKPVGGKNPFFS